MRQIGWIAPALAVALALCMVPAGRVHAAETYVGRTVDSRVVAAFAVPAEAAQAWMPEGWKALTLPKGPLAGANLFLVLIDRHLALAPDGKPGDPVASRHAVFAIYGVSPSAQSPRLFVARIYTTDPAHDPYGVAKPAAISRTALLSGPGDAPAARSEDWTVVPSEGGRIDLSYRARVGTPVLSDGESLNYSAANPDFYRIYRYRQLDDLALSVPLGKAIDGEVTVTVEVPELAAMFDGSERLVALISRPLYVRDIYLP